MAVADFARELERRWDSAEEGPPAEALAELFRFTFGAKPESRALLNFVHGRLLRRTISHARSRTSFYAGEAYADWIETGAGEPPDLSCWPVLERPQVIERFDELIASDVTFNSVCHTSGATGPSLNIYKSSEELAFLWSYYSRLLRPAVEEIRPVPLILSLPNFYHGVPVRLPSFGKVFVSGVTDDLLVQDAVKVLQRRYRIPGHDARISVISGLSYQIKFFTSFLIEQGYFPRDFGIRSLNIIGSYTSKLTKSFLGEAWRALIFERFTLTESAGGANKCLHCGHYHLDPHVIGEVVDPDTLKPLEEGVGLLVLTQLHPFVQMQPLIRYYTGDLVRKVRSDCAVTMTFDFLGKTSNCVGWKRDGATEWLLFSSDLYEIINEMPDIRLVENFSTVTLARDRSVGSPPVFSQRAYIPEYRPFTIELKLELRYAPHCYPDRLAELSARIREGLRAANPVLAARLDEWAVVLDIGFAGPGALGNSFVMKV
jgi:hypothetical protein